ncbi:8-amino-7-oxononanoate synthase [Crenothrix polyspora]|uniref:8-amino-7-oxononanoate synthase n=1 Tax=Crenothrix polyspora TaxID=360316 RepID=A0A1R4H6C3_9GAMM|nr:8-amino-7-oxononanoate synthase [Crenothrix polyspora]SJM91410.1 8-amino-7-oxononanoate synthase [Crenothrix polyspora]
MRPAFAHLADDLDNLRQQNRYRSRRVVQSVQGVYVQMDGRKLVNFCSNDYLGLAQHPDVINAFKNAVDEFGVGSGSAHLICGHSAIHHALEDELADFTGRDRALLFSTGYMANVGIITALLARTDAVFEDRLNHASLLDGGLASGAIFKRYAHADTDALARHLQAASGNKLIVTDGVFSMDGDFAPLDRLSALAKQHNAWLMVDDAHGLGVIGTQGKGVLDYYGVSQDDVPILMGTLGKGFGTFGAFVAGSETLIETLIQKARTYIYTTAMPTAVAAATRASLLLLIKDQWRREKLHVLSDRFKAGANDLGLPLMPSASAIQPLLVGDSQAAVALSNTLFKAGFLVSAIRPPTVAQGSARLRITFSALHEIQHVDGLLDALSTVKL